MINARITNTIFGNWQKTEFGWQRGDDYIEIPFSNYLDSYFFIVGDNSYLLISEIAFSSVRPKFCRDTINISKSELELILNHLRQAPFAYLILSLEKHFGRLDVFIETSEYLPLTPYLIIKDNRILINCNYNDLTQYCSLEKLNKKYISNFIFSFAKPNCPDTFFTNLYKITSATTFKISNDFVTVKSNYTDCQALPFPQKLNSNINPENSIEKLMESFCDHLNLCNDKNTGVLISGGVDSAIIALYLSRTGRKIPVFSIIMAGEIGISQLRRLKFLKIKLNLDLHYIYASDFPILHPDSNRWNSGPSLPWGEAFEEQYDVLFSMASKSGINRLITGIGGDEAFSLYWQELSKNGREIFKETVISTQFIHDENIENIENNSQLKCSLMNPVLSVSALNASSSINSLMYKHNIIGIHPFTWPPLVQYSNRLPIEWRENKQILLNILEKNKLSEFIKMGAGDEKFSEIFSSSLRDIDQDKFLKLFNYSFLEQNKIIDAQKFIVFFNTWKFHHNDSKNLSLCFYAVIISELTLSNLLCHKVNKEQAVT